MKQDGAPKKPKTTKKRVSDKPKTKVKTETSKKAKVSTSTTAPAPAATEQSAAKSNTVAEQPAAAPTTANQTVAQPIAQPALPPQMAMGQRKSKVGLIIAICAAVLVVLLALLPMRFIRNQKMSCSMRLANCRSLPKSRLKPQ